jgi:transcriptional regulator with XRE-family HTH domain
MAHSPRQPESLGDLIYRARRERELTLRALAEQLGCAPSYVSDIEHNRRIPGEAMLGRLAQRLGLDVDDLMARAGRLPDKTLRYLERQPEAGVLLRWLAEHDCDGDALVKIHHYAHKVCQGGRGKKR